VPLSPHHRLLPTVCSFDDVAGQLVLATLVPLSELRTGRAPRSLDPTRTTYLHCAAGVRVQPAAALMRSMGFARVEPLREGFAALAELGFELSTARAHGTADAVVL
jgi:rhodanese-related sulfurtransferase